MTSAQKVIKYIAIAFAIFLIITIISSIVGLLAAITGIFAYKNNTKVEVKETTTLEIIDGSSKDMGIINNNINELNIELLYTNLEVKLSDPTDAVKVESSNSNIKCEQIGEKLVVSEKEKNIFFKTNTEVTTLYLPSNIEFEKIILSAGAGKINIDSLTSKEFSLELGAGEVIINDLKVSEKCKIEGGAGKINVNSGTINNLDLDMGVGAANIKAKLLRENKINAGIGSLNITLDGSKEDYSIKVDKGIGSIRINGAEAEDNAIIGNGPNSINVEGGVGSIKIDCK